MTQEENKAAIATARAGGRVKGGHSLFDVEMPEKCPASGHANWRTVACDYETDVIECSRCGKQRLAECDFDEEYA